jgi:hypothetical protein
MSVSRIGWRDGCGGEEGGSSQHAATTHVPACLRACHVSSHGVHKRLGRSRKLEVGYHCNWKIASICAAVPSPTDRCLEKLIALQLAAHGCVYGLSRFLATSRKSTPFPSRLTQDTLPSPTNCLHPLQPLLYGVTAFTTTTTTTHSIHSLPARACAASSPPPCPSEAGCGESQRPKNQPTRQNTGLDSATRTYPRCPYRPCDACRQLQ